MIAGEERPSVWVKTMRLLLEEEGFEVAARPSMYPHHSLIHEAALEGRSLERRAGGQQEAGVPADVAVFRRTVHD